MTELVFHPGLALVIAAALAAVTSGAARRTVVLGAPALAVLLVLQLPDGSLWRMQFLGLDLVPFAVDKLSRLFALIFAIMALGGALFALQQRNRVELPAAFVYAGSAIGAVLARDLVSLFVFWELMALASTSVLWSAGTPSAYRASMRYLMIHLLGGAVLLAGIAGHVATTGSAEFTRMALDSPAQWLILAGFLINAGAPPLSAWVGDAYPEASWSGTVFLSAFTTKTAVYVLLRGFPGTELLVWIGLAMVFYGIVYALLENDMRRILAYSIVNQVGFMLAGIGIGTEMALNGTAAHAFTHIIYKALLLMSAGVVLEATGRRKCSELGGLFHSMPLTTICGTVGALAISSFPLTSGFISKSMISQAAADGHLLAVWLLLTVASAGVFLHAGIKFPWFVFFQRDSGLRPKDPRGGMRWAMVLFAILCIAIGIWPALLYDFLPYAVTYVPYTAAHVLSQLELLLFSGLAFFVLLPLLKRTPTITLDSDWIYRRLLGGAALVGRRWICESLVAFARVAATLRAYVTALLARHLLPGGALVRGGTTSSMALWVMLVLIGYLVLHVDW